jgi:2-keto-4-pentenoate hydratase/2-oxohepta-3-ene-1,7-dioic acid hydratase in catechol pathway
MRLATFHHDGGLRVGVVHGSELTDLLSVAPQLPTTVAGLLEAGPDALRAARAAAAAADGRRPLADVRLAAPIPGPRKFFGVGLNYAAHIEEATNRPAQAPTIFAKAPSCVTGPYDEIEYPAISNSLDYEGELGFVIGRRCRNLTRDQAHTAIAGYVVVNDFSVRDWQWQTSQWTLGKSFDTHGPFGPWLVTSDEIEDPHELGIRTFVNDELRQESNTRLLLYDCFTLVEHLSTACTLEPGDVVATGTPAGVGATMDPPCWLQPGDVVRVEIDGIGRIENVVAGARQTEPTTAREVAV